MKKPRSVCRSMWADLQRSNQSPEMTVRAVFVYRENDPFAVTFVFRTVSRRLVAWTFARDLLATGLVATSGDGNVRITPDNGDESRIWINVASPSGTACFAFLRADLEHALDDTEQLVPEGAESERIDWERELAALGEVA